MRSKIRLGLPIIVAGILIVLAGSAAFCSGSEHPRSVIWFADPPKDGWNAGLPIGNGRIGGMVLGCPLADRIGLNHDRLWRKFYSYKNLGTAAAMPEFRRLCLAKKWDEAQDLLLSKLSDKGMAQDVFINPFVPAGDLGIYPAHGEGRDSEIPPHLEEIPPHLNGVTNFERRLDLDTGVAEVAYTLDGVAYKREAFVSWPARVMVVRISASKPGMLSGEVTLSRLLDPDCTVTGRSSPGKIVMEGKFDEGVRFAIAARVIAKNGKLQGGMTGYRQPPGQMPVKAPLHFESVIRGGELPGPPAGVSTRYEDADEVLILLSIGTEDESASDPAAWCEKRLAGVAANYAKLLKEHVRDHRKFYRRVDMKLGEAKNDRPTSEVLDEARKSGKASPLLIEQLFNFGRYLAITSGRPMPAAEPAKCPITLQGIWNQDRRPAWDSDLHTDLNMEMSYWPLHTVNLPELMIPLADWLNEMTPRLKTAARERYGCDGVFVNMVMGLRDVGGADANCIEWTGGAAWFCQILWQSWEYTHDVKFLREKLYPFMKLTAAFYESNLIDDGHGRLVPCPSMSPENFIAGRKSYNPLATAATMDLELIRELFTNLGEAGRRLNLDSDKWARWSEIPRKLPTPVIASDGRLLEWTEDFVSADPGHRHRSHLVGFAPGDSITQEETPEYVEGVRKTLAERQSHGLNNTMSFSLVWDAQIHARLYEPENAMKWINLLVQRNVMDALMVSLFDLGGTQEFQGQKKLFMIEGQIGLVAAIDEMFFQDRRGLLRLLPALPAEIPDGSISGLRSGGGFEVDVRWSRGLLESATIQSLRGERCRVKSFRPRGDLMVTSGGRRVSTTYTNGIVEFPTAPGEVYLIGPGD